MKKIAKIGLIIVGVVAILAVVGAVMFGRGPSTAEAAPADVAERVDAYNEWFSTSELPKLHLYASPGGINPPGFVEALQAQGAPNYEAVFLGEGGHFIQEDHPEAIGQNISEWYSRIDQ
jgi:pimeloyl-ACP methyl ester carboxylesterase